MIFKNINKIQTVKKIEKQKKRLQRQVSRKYEQNKQGKVYVKTNNIVKIEQKIKLVNRRLTNIRNNHLHQATIKIVKTKLSKIVVETLNIKGMIKNRHLSKAISNQKLFEFSRQLEYKCEKYGIEFVKSDIWFPSSKLCSECGLIIDRDLNASINLSRYSHKTTKTVICAM